MSRKLGIEYPGARYHGMNRGDQREDVSRDDDDRQKFLSTLGEACAKAAWQVQVCGPMRKRGRTSVSLKWSAQRLQMGTWTCVSNLLTEPAETQPQAQEGLPLFR